MAAASDPRSLRDPATTSTSRSASLRAALWPGSRASALIRAPRASSASIPALMAARPSEAVPEDDVTALERQLSGLCFD